MAIRTSYPGRRSLRIGNYDYAQAGAYFVTATTEGRRTIFGEIGDAKTRLSRFGLIVERCWHDLAEHYPQIALDEFVVMPNHIHGLIWIPVLGGQV